MVYELWDVKSGNLIEEFASELEALAAIEGYLDANDPDLLEDLLLNPVPSTGLIGATDLPPVLKGHELLRHLRSLHSAGTPTNERVSA